MKKIFLIPLLLLVICLFINARSYNNKSAVRYTDTSFLKYIDTNRIVYDSVGNALKYYQYAALLTDGKHLVVKKDGALRFIVIKWHMEKDLKKDSLMLTGANINALSPKSNRIIPLDRQLIKNIPANIDTNMLVYDQDNQPLRFYQYFGLIFNDQAYVYGKKQDIQVLGVQAEYDAQIIAYQG